jgi:predicted nucleic acid-binding protein
LEKILTDTNVLLRGAQPEHFSHVVADNAIYSLGNNGDVICILPQNLIEFWNVCTRPLEQNGFGWSIIRASNELARLEKIFTVLPDSEAVYSEWKSLVVENSVLGKQVHDARIVAAMKVHGISKLLTFNLKDFKRFQHITLLDPNSFVNSDRD